MKGRTLAFLAEHRAGQVPALTERLVDTIIAGNTAYTGPTVPREDLERSCRDNIARVLELLRLAVAAGPPAGHEAYYDAARATGHRRAEQGLPLHDVLRSFRMGGRLIWDDLVAQAQDALDAEALREIGTRLWEVVDETSAQVALAYHDTERTLARADEQRKAALWEGLLGGRGAEPAFAREAVRLLDLPESGPYVVVATPAHDPGPLESALAAGRLDGRWVRRASGAVAIVAASDGAGASGGDLPDQVASALSDRGVGVPVGVSGAVSGPAGVDGAFREAGLVVQARSGRVGAACFDAVLPEALLLTSGEVATRLVDVWLAPVLGLPAQEASALLETLEAWVATGGSAVHTAERVHCHRNTVVNRLRRVAELTGQPTVTGTPVPTELTLALRARHLDLV